MNKRSRFQPGDRVEYHGSPVLGPPYGSRGTVALVAGVRGKSVHPDPSRLMTFVEWDGRAAEGVYTRDLAQVFTRKVRA